MTKFNDVTRHKLITAIRKGAAYEIACKYANIDYVSFRRWIIRGEKEKGTEYSNFCKAIKEAEGETALIWLDKIDIAMKNGSWQAAAWKLERRYFKHYSSRSADIDFNERLTELEEENKHKDINNGKA